jgi:hypothetical protein
MHTNLIDFCLDLCVCIFPSLILASVLTAIENRLRHGVGHVTIFLDERILIIYMLSFYTLDFILTSGLLFMSVFHDLNTFFDNIKLIVFQGKRVSYLPLQSKVPSV